MSRSIRVSRRAIQLAAGFVAALLILLGGSSAFAQANIPPLDENTSGTYYCLAYPDTAVNALDTRFPNNRVRTEASLWIFSPVANRVKITTFGTVSEVLQLEAGKFKVYTFKAGPVVDVINSVSRRTATIEADLPIVVYCYFAHIQGLEAWTPIPVDRWGTEYYAACLPGETVLEIGTAGETEVPHTVKPAPANILVMAAFDNTKVSLIPPAGMRFVGGPPTTVTLNAGEAYAVQSRVSLLPDADRQDDIAASQVKSDKPVGVISGNTRMQIVTDEVGLKNNAYKNMATEWIAPVEQHGTKFVYFPTWDGHRPGLGSSSERKREFARVYNTSGAPMKAFYLQPGGAVKVPFTVKRDTLQEFAIGQPSAVYYETEAPAQAMMHSSAIVKFNGSIPCFSGLPCLSYEAWAPYMVEMTPREQWCSFAPYYAPPNPGALQHFISVVTDTITQRSVFRENGSGFIFTRRIPGTDLIWGTMSVSPGEDHWLEARNGGKFYGVAFGIMQGNEEYRPGRAKRKDDGKGAIAGGGGTKAPQAMDPCAYEEYNALSYGYPLAPSRRVLKPADTLDIDTTMDCTTLTIKIRAINDHPIGLRSITLDPSSVKNARLVPVDPVKLSDILGRSNCTVQVTPIDPLQDAEATVLIKDRTGKVWYVYYHYYAERAEMDPAKELNFGEITVGQTGTKTVVVRNPLKRPLDVKTLTLADGNQGYTIVKSTPPVPTTLAPGDSIIIEITSRPELENHQYIDTLKVKLGCITMPLPLITETARPIIYVGDLKFGRFVLNRDGPKTMDLEICNIGSGELRFKNPNDPDLKKLMEWLDLNFTMDPNEITKLDTTVLRAQQCVTVKVTFTPTALGTFRTVARVWGSTRDRRDTSVWTAEVVMPGPTLTPFDWGKRWLTTLNSCTKSGVPFYDAIITVDNVGTSDDEVESLTLVGLDADSGYFKLDASDRQTTVIPGDVMRANSGHPLQQKVLFLPKDERLYSAQARLITKGGDTVFSDLQGIGIESHGSVTGIDFGTKNFTGPYPATAAIEMTVTITAKPTRPLTITNVIVLGGAPGEFWINPADLPAPSWTLQPSETRTVRVEFRPQFPGTRNARIAFVGDHSFCDDSTNTLVGYTFTEGVTTLGWDFQNVLTCDEPRHDVVLTNNGSEPIRVLGAAFAQPTPYFRLDQSGITYPKDLGPDEQLRIPVDFLPNHVGNYSANVIFNVIDPDDNSAVVTQPAEVKGVGFITEVNATIGTYHGPPGAVVNAEVTIDRSPAPNNLKSFYVSVFYNDKVVKLLNDSNTAEHKAMLLDGTICAGWDITVIPSPPGEFQAVLTAPAGQSLGGPGKILNLKYQLFLADESKSKLNLFMVPVSEAGKQCMRFKPTPGLITIDSICGINLRLIEATGFRYSLSQNRPNPFNPSTNITFSLGLDGPTRLVVYDASGRQVATLIDAEYMKPGLYEVSWDATGYPSGLYYYRLESGHWSKTSTMILSK